MSDYSRTIQDELQQYQQYAVRMSGICDDIVAARKANAEKERKRKQMQARLKILIIMLVFAAALGGGFIYLNNRFAKVTERAQAAVDRGDYEAAYHVYDDENLAGSMWGRYGELYRQVRIHNYIQTAQEYAASGEWKNALQTLRSGLAIYSDSQDLMDAGDEIATEAVNQVDVAALGGADAVVEYLVDLQDTYAYGDILLQAISSWRDIANEQETLSNELSGLDYQPDTVLSSDEWQAATVATQKTGLFLRTGPGQDYSKILTIPKGETVYEVAYSDGVYPWVCVMYDGTYGWVSADYLQF